MLAMETGKNGFFNLGNGEGYSVRQVIDTCEQISGTKIATVEESRRSGDPPRLIASAQKAFEELNWNPKFGSLEKSLNLLGSGTKKIQMDITINPHVT